MTEQNAFADSLEARIQILGMLPEEATIALVKKSSASWDFGWLDPVLASGWLQPNVNDLDQKSWHEAWFLKVLALFYFLPRIEFQNLNEDPLLGVLEPPLRVLSYPVNDSHCSYFRRVIKEISDCIAVFLNSPDTTETRKNSVAYLLVACVVMDMRKELKALTRQFPGFENEGIDISWLGTAFGDFIKNARNHNRGLREEKNTSDDLVNAVNVALRLSREPCLDILLEINPNAMDTLGVINGNTVWTLENFHHFYSYHCSPSLVARFHRISMNKLIPVARTGNRWTTFLPECAPIELAEAQKPLGNSSKDPYFLAMVQSGVYDQHPEESLALAVAHGHKDMVNRLMPLVKNWDLLEKLFDPYGSPLVRLAEWKDYKSLVAPGGYEHMENVASAFIDDCLRQGRRFVLKQERVNAWFGKGTVIEPFWSLAKWGSHALMLKMLAENSVDLQGLSDPSGDAQEQPLMEALDTHAPESASVIHSYLSRRDAHAMLAEIADEQSGPAA